MEGEERGRRGKRRRKRRKERREKEGSRGERGGELEGDGSEEMGRHRESDRLFQINFLLITDFHSK